MVRSGRNRALALVDGLLAAPVSLVVRDPEQAPYCAASPDPLLSQVITEQWPHTDIIDARMQLRTH